VPSFLLPQSRDELRELAELVVLAGWAPDGYRDVEGNYPRPRIEMAILHGASVGLGPVASVQSIAVIDGMPTIWGDGALALIERSGLLEDMSEEYVNDDTEGLTAICTMRRRGRPTPVTNRFSMAMAEQAHLLEKEGPWQTYPQRMLKMRARSWTIRDGFADVLRGLHLREEVEDYAGSAIVAVRHVSPDRPPALLRGVPRPRRGSKTGSGVEALWTVASSDPEVAAPPSAAADAASDAVPSDKAARPVPACPLDGVTETTDAEDAAPGVEKLPEDIALDIPEAEVASPQYAPVDADGAVGKFGDDEALGAVFGEVRGNRCVPPPDQQQDSVTAEGEQGEQALLREPAATGEGNAVEPSEPKPSSEIEGKGREQPLTQSQMIAEGRDGAAAPRNSSQDPATADSEAHASAPLLPGDQRWELVSVESRAAPPQPTDSRPFTSAGDKEAQPQPPAQRGISFGHRWAVGRPKMLPRDRKPSRRHSKKVTSNPTLVLTIEPSWAINGFSSTTALGCGRFTTAAPPRQ
jgi:hypothetical protein